MYRADTLLNLVWALFCAAALVYFVLSEFRRKRISTSWGRTSRGVALFLTVVSLFPCVSASDDSVRFEYLGYLQNSSAPDHNKSPDHSKNPNSDKSLATLVRLLEALESVQVLTFWTLAVFLCFCALALFEDPTLLERRTPRRCGRAPPSLLLNHA